MDGLRKVDEMPNRRERACSPPQGDAYDSDAHNFLSMPADNRKDYVTPERLFKPADPRLTITHA